MAKLFSYSSKIEFLLPESSPDAAEKFVRELQKWLSDKSGEDADRTGNAIYFAINPSWNSIFMFQGIDSGSIDVIKQGNQLVVKYCLSFLFPLVGIFFLDLLLIGISYLDVKTDLPVRFFASAMTFFLLVSVINTVMTIVEFPDSIVEIWDEIIRSK